VLNISCAGDIVTLDVSPGVGEEIGRREKSGGEEMKRREK
jgi:hypothetical protein